MRRREQVGLGLTMNQAVLELCGSDGYCTSEFRQGGRAGKTPGGEIREPRVENLARARQVFEATDDFLDGQDTVGMVRPVDVEPIGLESFQTRLHRGCHRLAAVAGDQLVGIGNSAVGELRREYEILAPPIQQGAPSSSSDWPN
ncbi:hypothetical protein V6679_13005 [Nocardia testacea]